MSDWSLWSSSLLRKNKAKQTEKISAWFLSSANWRSNNPSQQLWHQLPTPRALEGPHPSLRLHLGRLDGAVLWLSGQSVNVTVHTPTLLSVPSTPAPTERHDTAQRAAGCGRRPHLVIYRDSQAPRQHGRVLATAADRERIKKKTCDQTDRTNGEIHKHVRRGLTDELFPKPVQ